MLYEDGRGGIRGGGCAGVPEEGGAVCREWKAGVYTEGVRACFFVE